jgi:hypothetical protein
MKHLSLILASLLLASSAQAKPKKKTRAPSSSSSPSSSSPLWAPPETPPAPPPAATNETADSGTASASAASAPAADPTPAPPPPLRPAPPKSRAATLAANEGAPGDAKDSTASTGAADLERLRADYDRLRDELFRARSRAQIVEDGLWTSRLSATFRWKGGPSYLVHHASVRLDGADIWDSGDKPVTDDLVTVAERPVKPGAHALTLRIDIRPGKKSKDSDKLGYVSEHTFAIIVPDGKRTRVAIKGDEDGDAPEYEPEIEVELETLK